MFEQFEGRPSAHGAHGMRLQCQNKHKNRTPRTASPPLPGAPRRSSTVRSALASSSNRLRVFGVAASSGPAQQKAGHSPHALTLQGRPQARACFARRLARRCLHCAIIATARRTLPYSVQLLYTPTESPRAVLPGCIPNAPPPLHHDDT